MTKAWSTDPLHPRTLMHLVVCYHLLSPWICLEFYLSWSRIPTLRLSDLLDWWLANWSKYLLLKLFLQAQAANWCDCGSRLKAVSMHLLCLSLVQSSLHWSFNWCWWMSCLKLKLREEGSGTNCSVVLLARPGLLQLRRQRHAPLYAGIWLECELFHFQWHWAPNSVSKTRLAWGYLCGSNEMISNFELVQTKTRPFSFNSCV